MLRFLLLALVLPPSCFGWIEVRVARIPEDLPQIRECRLCAFDKPPKLASEQSFVNGDQLQREGYLGIIAKEKLSGRVMGTADLNVEQGVVNNVFVRKEARGRGIGISLMEGVESVLGRQSTLTLNVNTQNIPAVRLTWRRRGYLRSYFVAARG